jgi:hypothetical protein
MCHKEVNPPLITKTKGRQYMVSTLTLIDFVLIVHVDFDRLCSDSTLWLNESSRNTYLLSVNVHSNKVKLSTENKYHRNWYPSQSVLSEQSLSKSKCTIRTKSIKVKVYYQNKVYQIDHDALTSVCSFGNILTLCD